jgi:hypothetical protein
MPERGLGRLPPSDTRHLEKFPLTAATRPTEPMPVVLGTNWYTGMDEPEEKDGAYWIRVTGSVRGGHAYCLEPPKRKDHRAYWNWYNQGNEGACVGFAVSRMQTLYNRKKFVAGYVYLAAQKLDEWPGENYPGTSVRAGMEVARTMGMWLPDGKAPGVGRGPYQREGIAAYRWPRSVKEMAACLSPHDDGKVILDQGYVVVLNSWGSDPQNGYPHRSRLELKDVERLVFHEDGDCAVATDR